MANNNEFTAWLGSEVTLPNFSEDYVELSFDKCNVQLGEGWLVNAPDNTYSVCVDIAPDDCNDERQFCFVDIYVTKQQAKEMGLKLPENETDGLWGVQNTGDFKVQCRGAYVHEDPNGCLLVTMLGKGVPNLSQDAFYEYGN